MKPTAIVIHCSASRGGDAADIDDWHKRRGFGRKDPSSGKVFHIGYHGVILCGRRHIGTTYEARLDGKIEPGRPDHLMGAHCAAGGMNGKSLGVCLIGNPGWDRYPTPRQIGALIHWLTAKCKVHGIPVENITQHSDHDRRKPLCASLNIPLIRAMVAEHIT